MCNTTEQTELKEKKHHAKPKNDQYEDSSIQFGEHNKLEIIRYFSIHNKDGKKMRVTSLRESEHW